ncbi:MAG: fructosamine kinase family protein [Sandaracinaceae bacterium]
MGRQRASAGDGSPVLIDPAVYGGHREVDLAMMRLFGGFGGRVFDAYDEAWPLAPGWRERERTYQLYPLMVHVNLFGGSYVGQVERAARAHLIPGSGVVALERGLRRLEAPPARSPSAWWCFVDLRRVDLQRGEHLEALAVVRGEAVRVAETVVALLLRRLEGVDPLEQLPRYLLLELADRLGPRLAALGLLALAPLLVLAAALCCRRRSALGPAVPVASTTVGAPRPRPRSARQSACSRRGCRGTPVTSPPSTADLRRELPHQRAVVAHEDRSVVGVEQRLDEARSSRGRGGSSAREGQQVARIEQELRERHARPLAARAPRPSSRRRRR